MSAVDVSDAASDVLSVGFVSVGPESLTDSISVVVTSPVSIIIIDSLADSVQSNTIITTDSLTDSMSVTALAPIQVPVPIGDTVSDSVISGTILITDHA